MDAFSAWLTALYEGGTMSDQDVSAYLLAFGAKSGSVMVSSSMQVVTTEPTMKSMHLTRIPQGRSYYWSEIMGFGTYDIGASPGSPGDRISNIMAANAGFKVKPTDKLTIGADYWYAQLVEENNAGDTELGHEIDVKGTIALMDNMKPDLIAA